MRDPDRIETILSEIAEVWKKYPDLRLGQLLLNTTSETMLYYYEDEDLVKRVKEHYEILEKI